MYFVTAFVPSLTACLANSPGNNRRTDVWISRLEIVERPLWLDNLDDSDSYEIEYGIIKGLFTSFGICILSDIFIFYED